MAHEPRTILVPDGSELARALDHVPATPVLLQRRGRLFRVTPEHSAHLGTASAIAAIDAATGSWSDLDADAVIDYIYRAREEGSRPADRP
jgi:hypothetical protein